MKNKNLKDKIVLREMFETEKDFIDAIEDAEIIEKLKVPTRFIFEVEELEEKIIQLIQDKNKFTFMVLFSNYKRYLFKHIKELGYITMQED